jgi:eukaryotic-like serine/threonine-protein kinase
LSPEAERTARLTPENWARIESVFEAAIELPAGRRREYLDQACCGDLALRAEVEVLLKVEQAASGSLESVTDAALNSLDTHDATPGSGQTPFLRNLRFELRRRLGGGAFGTVYEAYDRDHDTVVALKTLHRVDTPGLHRFKKEFRALADIYHPNLVTLYELIADGEEWFFTMELVHGLSFREYAGPGHLERTRAALRQLAESVCAVHQAGKLHCDLKPSNVLVTSTGRVVTLDFGLITEIGSGSAKGGIVAGTPSYMAPEQMTGGTVTEAADWYSVGVMLFESLTGTLPFSGRLPELVRKKQTSDPPLASTLAPGIPDDLDSLCRDLLLRSPEARPSGDEVLRRLGSSSPRLPKQQFLGRERELASLYSAFETLQEKQPMLQFVQGDSGIGKTALVRHFLDDLARRQTVVVLEGRCYERESVPYKALDSLVENLCEYLSTLPRAELDQIIPEHASELVKLFPAFQRVVAQRHESSVDVSEPHTMRIRAFGAMRELIARLAACAPVIFFIDDLQWGDQDSGALLAELLRPPDAPAVLFIACSRAEKNASPLLEALLPLQRRDALVIEELAPDDARNLARAFVGASGADDRIDAIVRGAGGNPFLLQRLGSFSNSATCSGEIPDVHTVVRSIVDRLPEDARRLLEIAAVAARPIDLHVVQKASGLAGDVHQALAPLRAERLVRLHRLDVHREIEPYHDRIRRGVVAELSADTLKSHHRSLAFAWEEAGSGDGETLAVHFHAAGENEKAGDYAVAAGDKASEALAFDSASRMYRLALSVMTLDPSADCQLRAKLGDALSNAARGSEGAVEYLRAAERATGIQALELRRRAAAQYLTSGHLEEGMSVLRAVLKTATGRSLATTPSRALLSLLWRRTQVNLRGLHFREREVSAIPSADLLRIDAYWVVAHGLGLIDTIRASDFHASHMLYALRAGERYRIVRALAVEAGYHAISGGRKGQLVQGILQRAMKLAEGCDQPHGLAITLLTSGIAAFLLGRWSDARRGLEHAAAILQERCVGVAWELATARLMGCAAMLFLGDLKDLAQRITTLLHDADARGDLYEATALRTRVEHATLLAADRPDTAREHLAQAIARWPGRDFHAQHWWSIMAQAEIELYCEQPARALELWLSSWPRIRRSLLLRVQYIRIESLHHRAVCALAAAGSAQRAAEREKFLRLADSDARRLEREKMVWGDALAALIHAGVAAARGRRDAAASLFELAEIRFRSADMSLFAAAARRRRGELLGGPAGESLVESADAWMRTQNILQPEAMTGVLAPMPHN